MSSTTAETPPNLPFDSFRICLFSRHKKPEIAFTVLSLIYGETFLNLPSFPNSHTNPLPKDTSVFSIIVVVAGRSALRQRGVSGLLGTIARDATAYFFVIFSTHFVLAMTILFARVSLTMHLLKRTSPKRFL